MVDYDRRKRGKYTKELVAYHDLGVTRVPDDGVDAGGEQFASLAPGVELSFHSRRRGDVHVSHPPQLEPRRRHGERARDDASVP